MTRLFKDTFLHSIASNPLDRYASYIKLSWKVDISIIGFKLKNFISIHK